MLEKYYKYKLDYKEYVLLFKYGLFYETFELDAHIINRIFKYKLVKIKDTFKCGFPISKLSNVLDCLCDKSINYVVIDDNINIKEFEDNKYSEYKINNEIIYNINSINKIINYLNNNLYNIEINNILNRIESIINER